MNAKPFFHLYFPLLIFGVLLTAGCGAHSSATAASGQDDCCSVPKKTAKPAPSETRCNEHNLSEDVCGICHPEFIAKLAPGQGVKVRLPSKESMKLVDLQVATVEYGTITQGITCLAEIEFLQNRMAQISTPVGGLLKSITADLGTQVAEGQIVARLWSPAIADTISRAVLAQQTLARERRLREQRVTSEQALQEAEAAFRAASQQALALGFDAAAIESMAQKPAGSIYLEIRAPIAGEITERSAVAGALVEPGKSLFTVVDHSAISAMLAVPEGSLTELQPGQSVEIKVDSLPSKTFTGKLTWIAPRVDDRTRMGRARAEIPNPDGLLKDKMFAKARVITGTALKALVCPEAAIQNVEGKHLVFVKLADDLFEARAVEFGGRSGGSIEIRTGLKAGESIAVSRTFSLKSQLLMSRLGAGCADD